MNNNFITVILSILMAGLLICMVAFGIVAYKELGNTGLEDALVTNTEGEISIIEKREDIETPQVIEQTINDVETAYSSNNIKYDSSDSRTRYFYNQLDNYSKVIYDGMASNIDNMKTGTYKLEFGESFSELLSQSNGQELLGNYYQSAIEAFTYDNPIVFFLDPTKMYLNIRSTTKKGKTTYNVFITNKDDSNYLAKGFDSAEQVNECQAQIEREKNNILSGISGSTEKKIREIHDFLVDNLTYDQTVSENNIYNLYGGLVTKNCVCEGYAKAFKYLLDESGIDNVIVIGTGVNSKGEVENHAWNYVAINGNWYATDVTWDDPIIQGGGILTSSYRYKYFLKGLTNIEKDHVANGQFTEGGKIFSYPTISNYDYK